MKTTEAALQKLSLMMCKKRETDCVLYYCAPKTPGVFQMTLLLLPHFSLSRTRPHILYKRMFSSDEDNLLPKH